MATIVCVAAVRKPTWLCSSCWRSLAAAGRLLSDATARHNGSHTSSSVTVEIGGSPITFSTGRYANLADGAALVQSGNTSVMVTAVSHKNPKANTFGVPLLVDYRERAAAAGRIPQNFLRRELRASDSETVASRFIDRSIRPLFPAGYSNETQVICNMLAVDYKHDPKLLSVNGASAALVLSDIPWNGPIAAMRVGLIDNSLCVNPNLQELEKSKLNIIVASTKDRIVMVEGSAHEVREEKLCEAVLLGFQEAQPLLDSLLELRRYRKKPTRDVTLAVLPPELTDLVTSLCREEVNTILTDSTHMKASRDEALFAVLGSVREILKGKHPDMETQLLSEAFWDVCRECVRGNIIDREMRCDGRRLDDLRPLNCEVDVFEPLHGSAVFKRGETQVFCAVTFDSLEVSSKADFISAMLGAPSSKQFMLHYEFPPFATNEIGKFLMAGRREIGHGALAEKALLPLLPKDFQFTIRVNSQVLDSNGSSSMASVCGGSLALFDAGVPMSRAAAGVACGLFVRTKPDSDEIEKYQILTDILGIEDALGHMDFKMAGTREGITSIQVDVKGMPGIPYHIFEETVMKSRDARHRTLDIMDQCQSEPRPGLKKNGPLYATIEVPIDKRKKLVGIGGHRIRTLISETGADLYNVSDDRMSIFAPTKAVMENVMNRVETLMAEEEPEPEFEFGAIYPVTVKEIRDYGVMVEFAQGGEALLHKTQISHVPHKKPTLEVGQVIKVKYLGRDQQTGRHRISRKALFTLSADSYTSQQSFFKALSNSLEEDNKK